MVAPLQVLTVLALTIGANTAPCRYTPTDDRACRTDHDVPLLELEQLEHQPHVAQEQAKLLGVQLIRESSTRTVWPGDKVELGTTTSTCGPVATQGLSGDTPTGQARKGGALSRPAAPLTVSPCRPLSRS